MIFLKRWFAYNKIMQGDIYEYQEKTIMAKGGGGGIIETYLFFGL
jgi:hypothetical protein